MKLLLAFLLDLWLGDPEHWPHPVRWIGWMIGQFENYFRRTFPDRERFAGILLAILVCSISFSAAFILIYLAALIHPVFGFFIEVILIYTTLSVKNLRDSAFDVMKKLEAGDLSGARKSVGKIVGRDTENMTEGEAVRAAVETVAENTVDGIISPLFYAAIGGAPLAIMFKAASTLDSMVGYKNQKYEQFGWASARFDDLLNFIPARISGFLIAAAAWPAGLNAAKSLQISLRDGRKHASPNSGIPEAAFAGALGIQLGGVNYRGGIPVEYPRLGDPLSVLQISDIQRAVKLSFFTSILWVLILFFIFSLTY